jgi:hypothetical protein
MPIRSCSTGTRLIKALISLCGESLFEQPTEVHAADRIIREGTKQYPV